MNSGQTDTERPLPTNEWDTMMGKDAGPGGLREKLRVALEFGGRRVPFEGGYSHAMRNELKRVGQRPGYQCVPGTLRSLGTSQGLSGSDTLPARR